MGSSQGKRWLRQLQSRVRSLAGRGEKKRSRSAILRVEALETRTVPTAGFTAGDIAVLQLAAASSNTTGAILQLSPSTAGQSTPTPLSLAATGLRFSDAGTSSFLSDTNDGTYLAVSAYNTGVTAGNLDTIATRGVGTVSATEVVAQATTYTVSSADATAGNKARSATSTDDSNWYITDGGGLYTNNDGNPTFPTGPSLTTNTLDARSFGGFVYISSTATGAGTAAVYTAASPTATSLVPLLGLPADSKIQDFYLIQSGHDGSTYDVLYTLDQNSSNATINKFSLVNGSWVSNGSTGNGTPYTLAANGGAMIAANDGSGGAYVYVTTSSGTADNSLVRLTDTAGWDTAINISTPSNVTLYTATGTTFLKGLDFAPEPATATTTTITSISPLMVNQGQAVSFTATVMANSGSTAPTGGLVEFFNGNNTTGTLLATATTETTSSTTGTFLVSSTTVPAGTYSNIQAYYVSNTGFSNSNTTTAFGQTLTVTSAVGTQTAISSITPLTSNVGTSISFSATVMALSGSAAPGAGSVAFYNGGTGGTLLATATSETTNNTTATFTVSSTSVPAGNYNDIQAFYTPNAGFGKSNSSVFGSTLQVNIPGVIAAWTFPTTVAAPDNSPVPNLGSGTATTLGMTNNYTYSTKPVTVGSVTNDDVPVHFRYGEHGLHRKPLAHSRH